MSQSEMLTRLVCALWCAVVCTFSWMVVFDPVDLRLPRAARILVVANACVMGVTAYLVLVPFDCWGACE